MLKRAWGSGKQQAATVNINDLGLDKGNHVHKTIFKAK